MGGSFSSPTTPAPVTVAPATTTPVPVTVATGTTTPASVTVAPCTAVTTTSQAPVTTTAPPSSFFNFFSGLFGRNQAPATTTPAPVISAPCTTSQAPVTTTTSTTSTAATTSQAPATTTTSTATITSQAPVTTTTSTTTTTTTSSSAAPVTTPAGPPQSLVSKLEELNSSGKFDITLQFLNAAPDLKAELNNLSDGPFTFFVPTDDQWDGIFNELNAAASEGFSSVFSGVVDSDPECIIRSGDSQTVEDILEYFIIDERKILEANFITEELTTKSGEVLDVQVSGGTVTLISQPETSVTSTIAVFDNVATNGVVHELSGFLSPAIGFVSESIIGVECQRSINFFDFFNNFGN